MEYIYPQVIPLLVFAFFGLVVVLILFENHSRWDRRPIRNFSDDFEYVIYRANLPAQEIIAKLEKHDPEEVFMEYEFDRDAQTVCLHWHQFRRTTIYRLKIFEHPDECIVMLQYVDGVRDLYRRKSLPYIDTYDLNLFWKCIADAEPIPFYTDRMYVDEWDLWER